MGARSLFQTLAFAGGLSALTFAAMASAPLAYAEVRLNGSGASFPAPIYAKWFKDFSAANKGIRVDYQSKGSGAGIQDFINTVVDFAGSDAAMTEEQMAQVKAGVVLLPVTAGEIVLAYNLAGVSELRLPREVYPAIFTGEITRWNDARIAAANPGVALPDQAITVVVRSDSSGTSYVFTGHLSAISETFRNAIGQSTAPTWFASDRLIKAPKNDGVTAQIRQIPGAIGYIEYGFAKLTKQPMALLENRSGQFVYPDAATGAAALDNAQFPDGTLPDSEVPNLIAWVWDPEGADSYPIVTFTWLLAYREQDDAKAAAMRQLVEYLISAPAQSQAEPLGYIPLPASVIERVRAAAAFIQ